VEEPLQRVVIATHGEQRVGVRVEQPRRGLTGALRVQLWSREHSKRLFQLAEVGAGAGGDDAQFVGVIAAELRRFGATGQLDGPLGASDTALAVGDQGQQHRLAAHPSGGT